MFGQLKNAVTAWKVWGRLKEAGVKGTLYTALVGLVGAVGTAVVAKLTTACPDLFANIGAIVTAGIGGAWAFYAAKRPVGGSLVRGAAAAGIAAIIGQIKLMCGPDFMTVAPTILTAGAFVGAMAWLNSPKDAPPAQP